MSYSTTYERLRSLAALAAGWGDRANLGADELLLLNEVPNEAQHFVAHERDWPGFVKSLTLTVFPTADHVLLPADFESFHPSDGIAYTSQYGYPDLAATDLAEINHLRSLGGTSGPPQYYALGGTVPSGIDGLLALSLGTPTSGSIDAGTHYWLYRYTDGGQQTYSVQAALTQGSGFRTTLSGWPQSATAAVAIYRTAAADPATFKLMGGVADTQLNPTYLDNIADSGLDAVLSASADAGRRKLELWPRPGALYTLATTYRRAPATMAAAADLPDLPVALHAALRSMAMIVAFRRLAQSPPAALLDGYAAEIALAERTLLQPGRNNTAPLRDLVRRRMGVEQGCNRDIHADYPWHG